jgi:hypothetical protein
MLPAHELDTFLITVEEAIDLARTGQAADGYQALLAGLYRAKEAGGKPWGDELVTRYRDALERFAALYGIGRAGRAWLRSE